MNKVDETKPIWFAFGDSITDMGYYLEKAAEVSGTECISFGYSGDSYGVDYAGYGSLLDRCDDLIASGKIPAVITLFAGTNDFGHSGTVECMVEHLQKIIRILRKNYPDAKILILTPLQRDFYVMNNIRETNGAGPNLLGKSLLEYVDAIRTLAQEEKILVLDLYEKSGVTYENARQYTLDGLHPTPEFGIVMGEQIGAFIREHLEESAK